MTQAIQISKPELSRPDPHEYRGLVMAMAPAEAKRRVEELQAFVASVMVRGEDYGVIPGTEKPTLYQPGAQKLAELYGLGWRFEDVSVVEDWEKQFFFYRRRCVIFSRRDDRPLGEGIGSCNSKEDRYAVRWVFENEVPRELDKAVLPVKEFTSKAGRKFRKFRIPNPDICSIVNTIDKMASKRAYVAAIIGATRSAGLFTQDVEDLPNDAFGRAEEGRSWEQRSGGVAQTMVEEDDANSPLSPYPAIRARLDAIEALIATAASWDDCLRIRAELGSKAKPQAPIPLAIQKAKEAREFTAEEYRELGRMWQRVDRQIAKKEASLKPSAEDSFRDPDDAAPESAEREPGID